VTTQRSGCGSLWGSRDSLPLKKAVCWITSFSILLVGCYSESVLTSDQVLPSDATVIFHLADGSSVESGAGGHERVEDGYQVVGKLMKGRHYESEFAGVVRDSTIQRIGVEELNVTRTALAGVFGFVGLLVVLGIILFSAQKWNMG
jgi:hypothetical protein